MTLQLHDKAARLRPATALSSPSNLNLLHLLWLLKHCQTMLTLYQLHVSTTQFFQPKKTSTFQFSNSQITRSSTCNSTHLHTNTVPEIEITNPKFNCNPPWQFQIQSAKPKPSSSYSNHRARTLSSVSGPRGLLRCNHSHTTKA